MNFTPRPTLTGRAVRCGTPNGGTWPTVSLLGFDPAIVHMFGVDPNSFGYGPCPLITAYRGYSRAMA